jgi:dihydroflavonol-4-reductase
VVTSSFAAVGYSPKPVRDYSEDDWTDPDTPGLPPYPRSKAIAERAAWDFLERHPDEIELVVLNPTFIIGPTLVSTLRSSLVAIKAIAEGTMAMLPRQRFGVADVRDVADAHLKAAAIPAASNKRYLVLADGPTISWLELAQAILAHVGASGAAVDLREVPGEDPTPLTIHNDRAKRELGWQPRSAHTTIVETVDSLRELGLLRLS